MAFSVPSFAVAVSFGVLAHTLHWGLIAPLVCSAIVFSASAQFAIAGVLGGGGGPAAAIVAALLVNARFAPMGIAVASSLKGGTLRRAIEAQATNDASWALANQGGGRFNRELLIGATLPQFVAWVGGTALGLLAGDAVGNPTTFGLDVIFPAFFLGLLLDELRQGAAHVGAALIAGSVALASLPLAPPGVPIIAACVGALLPLLPLRLR
ncbi:MAG: AzlC family ABC transporter permease [Gaiellaceae bacterium]